ncbi:MAG: PrgI family protein, partial [Patescibacteria group bacterium]
MAQFQVPQFIETESKIIGPLTLKQFLYIAAAGLTSFFLFFILQTWLWLIITALIGIAAASFAFIKINGQPLSTIFRGAFLYFWQPKLYLWQREQKEQAKPPSFAESFGRAQPSFAKAAEGKAESKTKIKSLWSKLLTTTSSIAKREKMPTPLIKKTAPNSYVLTKEKMEEF